MRCEIIKVLGTWRDVADAARTTVHMDPGTGMPSDSWKKHMLLAQHSPIRKITVNWKWHELPYWVSVHLVRHKFGIEHWVRSQRTDRTGEDRSGKRQDAPIEHECVANLESIIFISRRRMCSQAAPETRLAWRMFLHELAKIEPVVASCCVPECVYRGFCPEFKPCGFCDTDTYREQIEEYRRFKS